MRKSTLAGERGSPADAELAGLSRWPDPSWRAQRIAAGPARRRQNPRKHPCAYRFTHTPPLDHHALDLGDGLGGVEALRAGLGAVHDGVAAVEPERVLEIVEPLAGRLVAAVLEPAVGLQQRGRAEEALAVPPVARAGGRAAGAQDALVEAVELLAVLVALLPLLLRGGRRRSAATARSTRAGRRNWSGRAPGPSPPAWCGSG